jgi:flagellar motor protein MotB
MVTLLLTFFVMLLSLADVQDPELFNQGRDSFIESLTYIGLGSLLGKEDAPSFGDHKTKHFVPEPDESPDHRIIDAEAEELRRIVEKLRQLATIVPSQIMPKAARLTVANVHFSSGRLDLNEPARRFLTGFCRDLQQQTDWKPVELYVLGLAADAEKGQEQWLLSAKRARAVADFLENTLSPPSALPERRRLFQGPSRWSVYSWGVGAGGNWVGPDSPISEKSQILIGVLRRNR